MNEIIAIEGKNIEKIEYNGQAVISLSMVDRAHSRPEGTAQTNFKRNRARFIFGEDYFSLPYKEWEPLLWPLRSDKKCTVGGHRGNRIFLTYSGYLMLAKTFTDDLSWKIPRLLVKSYFKATTTIDQLKDDLIASQKQVIHLLTTKKGMKPLTEDRKTGDHK